MRKDLITQAKKYVKFKNCLNCGHWLDFNNNEKLCEKCAREWKYMIKIDWISFHHGNYLLTVKFSYFEDGEYWFSDKFNIQLDKTIKSTKEAYLKIVNNPVLVKDNLDVDVDKKYLKVRFPRYAKWIGVDLHGY